MPGTGVLMADGSVKAIEDIEVGDWVWAEDPETSEKGARQVTDLIVGTGEKELVKVVIDGHVITATDEHPFWVESKQQWIDAEDLHVGDIVLTADGELLDIDSVATYSTIVSAVHNLTVDDLHTYYVLAGDQSVLVHNCNGRPNIRKNDIDTYQGFKDRSKVGDGLEGHEILQHAWLQKHGHATTRLSTDVSKANPVLAMKRNPTHYAINGAQTKAGFDLAKQTAVENIMANRQIMLAQALGRQRVNKLTRKALDLVKRFGL